MSFYPKFVSHNPNSFSLRSQPTSNKPNIIQGLQPGLRAVIADRHFHYSKISAGIEPGFQVVFLMILLLSGGVFTHHKAKARAAKVGPSHNSPE